MYKYTKGLIVEKISLPKGKKILMFCKNLGLIQTFYPYKIKNLNLDNLNLISTQLKYTQQYTYLNQYKVIDYFENIRNSLEKKIIAQTILEILKKTLPENQKENDIFNLTISFLKYIDNLTNSKDIEKFQKYLELYIEKQGYKLKRNNNLIETLKEIEKILNIEIKTIQILEELLTSKI